MRFEKVQTLEKISKIIGCSYVGNEDFPVFGMNEIHVVQNGEIVFVDHPKYYEKALFSNASVILIDKKVPCPKGKTLLISDDPFRDFNKLTHFFKPFVVSKKMISETSFVGKGTIIQPNVFIGNKVSIGKNCLLHSNVTIYDNCIIGDDVTIHSGTVLGGDAFYYKNRKTGYEQLISGGRVVIENNVDLGALCTIDKGVTGDTIIQEGTKIDNQVQIGHDTIIGKKCLIAAQTGIAGCTIIEDEVIIWGQVGISSGLRIGKKAIILAQTGVSKSLKGGKTYFGSPVAEAREKLKEMAKIKNLLKG